MATTLHAPATNTLLHAHAPAGERSVWYFIARLTDESGNVLKDEAGNTLVAYGQTPVTVLHAPATNTLLHAEDS